MTASTRIAELTAAIANAETPTEAGRQVVANACKELYHAIESDVVMADKDWMLAGMYNDLFNGNFSEPFMAEKKKETFITIVEIYNTRVVPFL